MCRRRINGNSTRAIHKLEHFEHHILRKQSVCFRRNDFRLCFVPASHSFAYLIDGKSNVWLAWMMHTKETGTQIQPTTDAI